MSKSNRIKDFFVAHSRDITPEELRHSAKVLYAPVSRDAEFIRCCEAVLSKTEQQRARRFNGLDDRQLFIQRRAFRRFCGSRVLDPLQSLSQETFQATDNGRPYLIARPEVAFSFSSCRLGFLGAWSTRYSIGVDIEDCTKKPRATELAQRYFSVAEARSLAKQSPETGLQSFFKLWCLKEAALKSIGEGIPYGLNAFEFELQPVLSVIDAPAAKGGPGNFSAHITGVPETCVAIVLSNTMT